MFNMAFIIFTIISLVAAYLLSFLAGSPVKRHLVPTLEEEVVKIPLKRNVAVLNLVALGRESEDAMPQTQKVNDTSAVLNTELKFGTSYVSLASTRPAAAEVLRSPSIPSTGSESGEIDYDPEYYAKLRRGALKSRRRLGPKFFIE
ncbi:hypothetical protein P389DRAFT_67965 [Cystobasidium minutum MCA 4210]|uniref:uncharacterized protein n=1 Tax=Cystobasidium minutum MCA 4210 TaxID=1397322 RepID=UPI0034CEE2E2|eukprot:jgi/Rhomi1/67965/CE67964_31